MLARPSAPRVRSATQGAAPRPQSSPEATMPTTPSSIKRAELQRLFAEGTPVVVIGAGCQRVGYDGGRAWIEVTRRVALIAAALPDPPGKGSLSVFLEAFWRGGLAPRSPAKQAAYIKARKYDIFQPPIGRRSTADAARTALGRELLTALSEGTRCLGLVISSGRTPVRHWQDVRFRRDARGALAAAVRADATAAIGKAEAALSRFVAISGALSEWSAGHECTPGDDGDVRRMLEREGMSIDEPLQDGAPLHHILGTLRIKAISEHAKVLRDGYFTKQARQPVSGATIEWMSELLWHVIACASGVPPSQSALAFYVNLVEGPRPTERLFHRSRPGEYRGELESLPTDLERLIRTYDHGLEKNGAREADGRSKLFRTLAATLVEMWVRDERAAQPSEPQPARQPPELDVQRARPEACVIALVSVYDLMLERHLFDVLSPEQCFHMVVPVWVGARRREELRWLWGTFTKRASLPWCAEHLTGPPTHGALDGAWRWCDQDAFLDVAGPIVVKVNGSPLFRLSDGVNATVKSLGLEDGLGGLDALDEVRPATIFSEYDSVTSMMGFSSGQDETTRVLPRGLTDTQLSWKRRDWVFLGDSFPEWLPRLRLAYRANPRSANSRRKIAIDRHFDWPELALLETLEVDPRCGDLAQVASYALSSDVPAYSDFLRAVEKRCQATG